MNLSQNDTGRAFEYGIAFAFAERLPAKITLSSQLKTAMQCFLNCSEVEKFKIVNASREVAAFLSAHDNRLTDSGCFISLQSDQMGQQGDVRDVIIHNLNINQEIGISAKNRHWAVKHSRLSEQIDFGQDWFGISCAPEYFHTIVPIFRELHTRQRRNEYWRDIQDKRQLYYMPVLQAFKNEINRLFNHNPLRVARGLVQYLLGLFDFYKVIKENGEVSIMSFNIYGTLRWGSRIPVPSRIIEISMKPQSDTTLFMTFDHGWQISFRIHNASSKVEPSLKFDINIIGLPQVASRHVISYG